MRYYRFEFKPALAAKLGVDGSAYLYKNLEVRPNGGAMILPYDPSMSNELVKTITSVYGAPKVYGHSKRMFWLVPWEGCVEVERS